MSVFLQSDETLSFQTKKYKQICPKDLITLLTYFKSWYFMYKETKLPEVNTIY